MTQYWLLKSEPSVYSIENLKRDKKTLWTGVRNYQARNYMMGEDAIRALNKPLPAMRVGDLFLFYHSNAEPSACAGVGRIEKVNIPDPDDKSVKPTWFCCEVSYVKTFLKPVPLDILRKIKSLLKMPLLQKGSRLSVQPVSKAEFDTIEKLSQ